MKSYPYGKKTPELGLPSPGVGDVLDADIEYAKLVILENAVLAGQRGVKNAIFKEGHYLLRKETDTRFSVALIATGSLPSLTGVVNGAFFRADSMLAWENLEKGNKYWLYVAGSPDLFENCRSLRTAAHKVEKSAESLLLVATVDLQNDPCKLDTAPVGKAYIEDVLSHASDSENPHGETLIQDEVIIHRRFAVALKGEQPNAAIVVDDQRLMVAPTIETNTEFVVQDKNGLHQLSDKENPELLTDNKTIIGAINELKKLIKG